MLRLSLTGRPALSGSDGRNIRLPRKAFVLAAHLALGDSGGEMTRRRAAEILWDDSDPTRRAGNLRQLLSRLADHQEAESFKLFDFDIETIRLNATSVEIDAVKFTHTDFNVEGRRILDLCATYSGDLLLGNEEGGELHRRWLRPVAARLRTRFVSLLTSELEKAAAQLVHDEIITVARRLLGDDPESEVALRVMIRTYFAAGDMKAVDRWRRRLDVMLRETERPPATETRALLAEIRGRQRTSGGSNEESFGTSFDPTIPPVAPDTTSPAQRRLPRISIERPLAHGGLENYRGALESLFDDVALWLWQARSFELIRSPGAITGSAASATASLRKTRDYTLAGHAINRDGAPHYVVDLVRNETDEVLWIRDIDVAAADPHTVQRIVDASVHHIEQSELRQLFTSPDRPTAYRSTLHAQRLLRDIDLPSIRRARQVLRTALTIDPTYAPALAAVAKSFRLEWIRLARGGGEELDNSLTYARRALIAEPDSGYGEH